MPIPINQTIGDPTLADGILDRLVHNAHRIELHGESMRKTKTAKTDKSKVHHLNLEFLRCAGTVVTT